MPTANDASVDQRTAPSIQRQQRFSIKRVAAPSDTSSFEHLRNSRQRSPRRFLRHVVAGRRVMPTWSDWSAPGRSACLAATRSARWAIDCGQLFGGSVAVRPTSPARLAARPVLGQR